MIVALWGRWHSLRNPDSLEQRLADTKEMIAIAERAGERDFALEARYYRVADLLESGDIVGVDVAHREYLSAEAELRDRFKRGLLLEGMRALMDGRLDEADTLAKQALRPASRAVARSRQTRFSSSMACRCGNAAAWATSSRRYEGSSRRIR